ncbi:MAG: ABC transporter ATP-binding protein [Acidobacteriota bacterium]
MNEPSPVASAVAPSAPLDPSAIVVVDALHKGYASPGGTFLPILKGLSLQVSAGEMLAIVGASGVGKSTLLHVLGTLDRPDSGRYLLGGADVLALTGDSLAAFRNETIGFVFQFHHLLPEFTALENAMMPALIRGEPWSKAKSMAIDLLTELSLASRAPHRPSELSGGEQQRVAIARALCNRPRLLLLDEPTGNLDRKTGDGVFALVRRLASDLRVAAILTTHNERLAGECDRTCRLEDGLLAPVEPEEAGLASSG